MGGLARSFKKQTNMSGCPKMPGCRLESSRYYIPSQTVLPKPGRNRGSRRSQREEMRKERSLGQPILRQNQLIKVLYHQGWWAGPHFLPPHFSQTSPREISPQWDLRMVSINYWVILDHRRRYCFWPKFLSGYWASQGQVWWTLTSKAKAASVASTEWRGKARL